MDNQLPIIDEIVIQSVDRVYRIEGTGELAMEITQIERHGTRSRLAFRFSEQAVYTILSVVDDIQGRKSGGNLSVQ